MKASLAPIALFVYNRPFHAERTIESLKLNTLAAESALFIFSDGPKDDSDDKHEVGKVRQYIKSVSGFKSIDITEHKRHLGLFGCITAGITDVINRFGRIIVMEDDLLSSPFFLEFLNSALRLYEGEEKVASIHAYAYPVEARHCETFFISGADCWGWATWKRGWDIFEKDGQKLLKELKAKGLVRRFNMDGAYPYSEMLSRQAEGKKESWAVLWYASAFLKGKLTLHPGRSLIRHIGNDGSGTNFNKTEAFNCRISSGPIDITRIPIVENLVMRRKMEDYFKSIKPSFLSRSKRMILDMMR